MTALNPPAQIRLIVKIAIYDLDTLNGGGLLLPSFNFSELIEPLRLSPRA
ncbi:MAG: hypothetical protein WA085_10265 [Sphingobium sp.]|nr:hypothetical protein [Sphingobium sp. CECT 9361]CAH0354753.1 hypothetical protein SPH9361_03142 [Sphingobium sp. CECT 9361]